MRLVLKLMLGATVGLMLPTAGQAKDSRTVEVSRATVEKKCGGDIHSDGGAIGCTIPCPSNINGKTCDYSCGGDAGPGCRIEVFTRTAALKPKKEEIDQAVPLTKQ